MTAVRCLNSGLKAAAWFGNQLNTEMSVPSTKNLTISTQTYQYC